MYKNCYVIKKPDVWNVYDVHLWTDEGYTVEEFQNYGYQECDQYHATHWGLKDEPLKKKEAWIVYQQSYKFNHSDGTKKIPKHKLVKINNPKYEL